MESIGSVLAGAEIDVAAKPRVHRVTLCVMTFAEVDVVATTAAEARTLAINATKAAKRTFQTAPAAHRVRIEEKVDWRRPELGTRWIDAPSA